ncbi:MAG: hypothetical protein D6702_10410 [Planctomycetota bacterium]|nr:MAG: hypothetical protein D6702_10410 [Planctomycetota bacterium]
MSGYWLPRLFRRILPEEERVEPAAGAARLAALRAAGGLAGEVAGLLLDRSADLVAAALAGLAGRLPTGRPLRVLAEGSLYWKTPGYGRRVAATLDALLENRRSREILGLEHANLAGSACAALQPSAEASPDR